MSSGFPGLFSYICCREEMMLSMSRNADPNASNKDSISYKTMYDDLKVNNERDKATVSGLMDPSNISQRILSRKIKWKQLVYKQINLL